MKKSKEKNAGAQAMAMLRAKKLSPKRRAEIAQKAAEARWAKKKEGSA